jgi:short-subunit dehydrogenase
MKNIWLIGASEGIGRALAKELSLDKNNFLILSARNQESLHELSIGIESSLVTYLDVSSAKSIEDSLATVKSNNIRVDCLIYIAGFYEAISAAEINMASVEKMIDINLTGAIRVMSFLAPEFIANRAGHVILIGSVAGYRGLPNAIGYSASKAGVINFAENLKCDLARYGIKIQVINPGFVKTRLTDKNNFKMPFIISPEEAAKNIVRIMQSNKFEARFPFLFANFIKTLSQLPYWLYFKIVSLIN